MNVLSHVAEAMVKITRERPEDPIGFFASFLDERGVFLEQEATTNALEKFNNALKMAEETDRELGNT